MEVALVDLIMDRIEIRWTKITPAGVELKEVCKYFHHPASVEQARYLLAEIEATARDWEASK